MSSSEEITVDDAVLDVLTDTACFAADMAALDHFDDVSSVRAPDGSAQRLTAAEMTRIEVHAALRNLLANGLIEPKPIDEINAILERGVTVR